MKNFCKELNAFFEATTVHGLAYLESRQTKCTRTFWFLVSLAALGIASYFLYQTVTGFDTKYTSTVIETRSIQDFPFPAVTFHPGEYNLKKSFLRKLLNQLEFTRYQEISHVRDNELFLKQFEWLISPMNNEVFDGVEKYLLLEGQKFVKSKQKYIQNDACTLVSLTSRKDAFKKLKKDIRYIFLQNMHKYNNFVDLINVLKNQVSPIIMEAKSQYNLSESEIKSLCKDPQKIKIKSKMETMLLSYLFLFIDKKITEVGAGDLATSSLITGLSRGQFNTKFNYFYLSSHKLITNIYNNLTNASLPLSILEFPSFFVLPNPEKRIMNSIKGHEYKNIKNWIELINIPDEAIRNYHYLWWTYNNNRCNITIVCSNRNRVNCSDPKKYILANKASEFTIVNEIKKNPELGKVIEGYITGHPCKNEDIVKRFKINSICNFHKKIKSNMEGFLKLMMFTKQNPLYLDTEEEYLSLFSDIGRSLAKENYSYQKDKVNNFCRK